MSGPNFIPLGDARERLNVNSRSQMQNLFPVLPHVYIKSRQTRLFPAGYIRGLAEHLDGKSATRQLVREFNDTDPALQLYREAAENLAETINSRAEHTPKQVAEMLGVARATISGWMKSGNLDFEARPRKEGQPVSSNPMGQVRVIKVRSLRRFLVWVAPR